MADYRPDPDELLKKISKSERDATRGRLKIFFGMCPGVGKTYAMLKAGQERQASGLRVVLGLVETHQRAETEHLLKGFEILPRRKTNYKGTQVEEFDLDQALLQKPELILVDELAHTNAPGSRHPKRYQDVEELLFAGIDVYTTLNVQHIESRVDLVYQITGVPVRESVPDGFLEKANEIEIIDISPEQLLKRLQDGKVYLGERAERAAQNFFKEEALIALRELALRFTAESVDDRLRDHMTLKGISGPWNTNERLMVAVSHSPFSARLIRAARRMAHNLEAPWVALFVDTGLPLKPEDAATLKKNLDAAQELGAEVIARKQASIIDAIMNVAREKNVTQIIMGRPDRRIFRDLFSGGNILDQLVNETSEIDIHIIRQKRRPKIMGFRLPGIQVSSHAHTYFKSFLFIIAISVLNYLALPYLGYRAIGFLFLISVLPVALLGGLGPTLLAALLSALIWDFWFIPPQFTFIIQEFQDVLMILAYFLVATVAGFLASRLRLKEKDLIQREYRANVLYEFEKKLASTSSLESISGHATQTIDRIFKMPSLVLATNSDGFLSDRVLNGSLVVLDEKDIAVAKWSFEHRKKAGKGTDTLFSSRCLCYPLVGKTQVEGVLIVYPPNVLPLDQENLLETVATNLASALERESLSASSSRTHLLEQSEKMHQTLLNSVSHELRTPLTSIMGIASALKENEALRDDQYRVSLVENLAESAERLKRTVENLLDMTRISTGVFQIQKEFFELGDFIQSWLSRSKTAFSHHPICFVPATHEIYIRGDEKLLDSVLTNLVMNACNYSLAGGQVEIRAFSHQNAAEFQVCDEGPGLNPIDLPRIFDRFYRGTTQSKGLGLGLSIVKTIVEVHGGTIQASNRTDRSGAQFSVFLPTHEIPDERDEPYV